MAETSSNLVDGIQAVEEDYDVTQHGARDGRDKSSSACRGAGRTDEPLAMILEAIERNDRTPRDPRDSSSTPAP